jgi:hypothetical protein
MKRYISAVLIPCLLLQLCGCYSMQEIQKDEFFERAENEDLQIKTNTGNSILFQKDNYILRSDSIIGKGTMLSHYSWIPETEFEGSIFIAEVKSFSMYEFSILNTTAGILLLGYLGTALVFGILTGFQ